MADHGGHVGDETKDAARWFDAAGYAADIASPSAGRKTCRVIDLGACGRSACRRTRTAIVLDHGECLGGQYGHCHQNDEQNNEQHVPSRFHPDREAGLHLG